MSRRLGNNRNRPEPIEIGMAIVDELERLNDNIESGRINIRTHHPLCFTPPNADWSMSQIDAASRFVAHAIETGAFVLPPKGGGNVAPETSGGGA